MSEARPVFSIIIPTYNRAHLLPRAIKSALAQTFTDFELIIVDDASTDETPQVMASFQDPRIVYLRQEQNGGASSTRNAGIKIAKGKYISFLDDDDELSPKFLQRTFDTLEAASPDVGFAWCGVRYVRNSGTEKEFTEEKVWHLDRPAKSNRHAWPPYLQIGTGYGLTVKRTCFDSVGTFDERLQAVVDTDLMFRLGAHYPYVAVPEVLVIIHRHNEDRLTAPTLRRARSLKQVIDNNRKFLEANPRLWSQFHIKLAGLYYGIGDTQQGRKIAWLVIAKQPFNLRWWTSWIRFELFGPKRFGIRKFVQRLIQPLKNKQNSTTESQSSY